MAQSIINPQNTILHPKRLLSGTPFHNPVIVEEKNEKKEKKEKHQPYERLTREIHIFGEKKQKQPPYDRLSVMIPSPSSESNRTFSPEEICGMLLHNVKEDAELYLGSPVKTVVVTVPAYFTTTQRHIIRDAGIIAGLNILRIISEPTAAAMAWGIQNGITDEQHVLIFDLGGGTLDVSLLSVEEGVFGVLAVSGDNQLGGVDFDNRLIDYFVKEFKLKYHKDPTTNGRAMNKFHLACEGLKHELSLQIKSSISVVEVFDGHDFTFSMTREEFEVLCGDLFHKCIGPIEQVIHDAQMCKSDINEIILIGGCTRIPKIRELLTNFFNGKTLNKAVNPEEAVAYGAAIQAAILTGRNTSSQTKDILLIDVIPFSLGIETEGGVMTTLIARNTTLPCTKTLVFSTHYNNQTAIALNVFEGEGGGLTKENHQIGQICLTGLPPMPKGIPQIEVTFDYDVNDILIVKVVEKKSGMHQQMILTNECRLSHVEVKRMLNDAKHIVNQERIWQREVEEENSIESSLLDITGNEPYIYLHSKI